MQVVLEFGFMFVQMLAFRYLLERGHGERGFDFLYVFDWPLFLEGFVCEFQIDHHKCLSNFWSSPGIAQSVQPNLDLLFSNVGPFK